MPTAAPRTYSSPECSDAVGSIMYAYLPEPPKPPSCLRKGRSISTSRSSSQDVFYASRPILIVSLPHFLVSLPVFNLFSQESTTESRNSFLFSRVSQAQGQGLSQPSVRSAARTPAGYFCNSFGLCSRSSLIKSSASPTGLFCKLTMTDLLARTRNGEQVLRGPCVTLQEKCPCIHCLSTLETTSS